MCVGSLEQIERKTKRSERPNPAHAGLLRRQNRRALMAASFFGSLAFFSACKSAPGAKPVGATIAINAPLGLPPVPIPGGNPPTTSTIVLGRRLFYDTSLSKDNSISCASCHNPMFRFADARPRSIGVAGTLGLRHAPTLLNVAYVSSLFWDGRAIDLEHQVMSPIADPLEMNQSHDASVAKLRDNPAYAQLFVNAFGTDDITIERVENALASFERTLLCGNSAFDRYQFAGKKDALTAAQVRGLAVFTDPHRGNCASCHTIGAGSALFTDNEFHNTGEGVGDDESFSDTGRFSVTKSAVDKGAFKTPTLRDVAVSGPYMHDGKLKTLKEVVDFYAGKGNSNPNLDPKMKAINLIGTDRNDLVEFMKSLTGDLPPNSGPPGKETPK
jgi:cytochrome c peroxidase